MKKTAEEIQNELLDNEILIETGISKIVHDTVKVPDGYILNRSHPMDSDICIMPKN